MNLSRFKPDLPQLSTEWIEARRLALINEINRNPKAAASKRWLPSFSVRFGLASIAVGVVAVIIIMALGTTPPIESAYASWTAIPHPATPTEATRMADECRDRLTKMKGPSSQSVPSNLILAEQRGNITTVMLGGPNSYAFCLLSPNQAFSGRGETTGSPKEGVEVISPPVRHNGGGTARVFLAQIGPDVTARWTSLQ